MTSFQQQSFQQIVEQEFVHLEPNYFNSAYFGPLPLKAQRAGRKAIEAVANPVHFPYEKWRPIPDQVRAQIGSLLGVSGEQVSHHASVSEVVSTVSLGFSFKEEDVVVMMEGDYPSNILPWMLNEKRRGYKTVRLAEECFFDLDRLRQDLPTNTKVLNVSHVMFNTGRRLDILEIGRLCGERNILFMVDVSQSFGGRALSQEEVKGCDIVMGATYKWLLGPYGHAFAYWSKRALRDVDNTHLSWQSTVMNQGAESLLNYSIEPLPGARRFDRGQSPNYISMHMLSASLEVLKAAQLERVQKHNQELVAQFLETYPKQNYDLVTPVGQHSNILCLRKKTGDSNSLESQLREKKMEASVREGNLRLSFHLFNMPEQVDSLVRALFV